MTDIEEYAPVPLTAANFYLFLYTIGVVVAYDEFANQTMALGIPETGTTNIINDAALNALHGVSKNFGFEAGIEAFSQMLDFTAYQNRVHPVRMYLDRLKWDGVPRLDTWLVNYAGADDTPYNRAVGRMLLIGAVRRVRQPGCKFDTMPVFEGRQGSGKSSLVRALAVRDEWFTDGFELGMDAQRTIEITSGKWFAEVAELANIAKKDVPHIRREITKQEDVARLAYGRKTSRVPRQFVLVGTVNESEYLTDQEGARRTPPVKTGNIDIAGFELVRDQIYAEAARREAKGEPATIPPELYETAAGEAEKRRVKSVVEETLVDMLEGYNDDYVTPETLYLMLGHGNNNDQIAAGRITVNQKNEIAYTMKRLGWSNTEDGKAARRSVPVTKHTKVQKRVWIIGKGTKQVEHTVDNPNQIDVGDILPPPPRHT